MAAYNWVNPGREMRASGALLAGPELDEIVEELVEIQQIARSEGKALVRAADDRSLQAQSDDADVY